MHPRFIFFSKSVCFLRFAALLFLFFLVLVCYIFILTPLFSPSNFRQAITLTLLSSLLLSKKNLFTHSSVMLPFLFLASHLLYYLVLLFPFVLTPFIFLFSCHIFFGSFFCSRLSCLVLFACPTLWSLLSSPYLSCFSSSHVRLLFCSRESSQSGPSA